MKQKLLCLLAALAFLLPARLSAFNYKYEGVTLRYEVIDEEAKTCKVSGYKDFSGALVIPDVANDGTADYSVIEIGEEVFKSFKDMTSVVISNSVTSIGSSAFYHCTGLTSVAIGNSVQTIGKEAFRGCEGLTSVVIPNSVKEIGWAAFGGCSGLIKSAYPKTLKNPFSTGVTVAYNPEGAIIEDGCIWGPEKSAIYFAPLNLEGEYTIPESVTEIGSSAFYNCEGLTSVEIGNLVETIGEEAFKGCTGLTSVFIPPYVTSIGDGAFNDCSGLIKSAYPNTLEYSFRDGIAVAYNPEGAIIEDGWIWGPEKTEIRFVPYDLEGDYIIPESVTSIGESAFEGCSGLTSVEIPESVASIGDRAFTNSGLTSVVIPNLVTSIGNGTFRGCSGLTSVIIPPYVTSIGNGAFNGCSGLTSVVIPEYVTSIGDGAFSWCSRLTSVVIGESVASIGDRAFEGSGLTSVVIGESVKKIGEHAFEYCKKITSIIFNAINCTSSKRIFTNCESVNTLIIGDKVKNIPAYFLPSSKSLKSLVIPNSVTSIGKGAFEYCSGLLSLTFNAENCEAFEHGDIDDYSNVFPSSVKYLVIGNEVKKIPANFLDGFYSKLTSVVIPNSVTEIGKSAFCYCNLDTIIMGHGIETIGSSAFYKCPASRIYITAQTPPEIESYTFDNYKGTLYLQGQAAVNAYDDDKYWGNFNNELMTVPTALEIEGLTSISGNAGDTFQLKAKMTPEDVSLPYILWRSTNPKIATVDHNGVVTLQEYSADDLTRAEGDEDNDGTCRIIAESLYFDGPIAEITVNNTGISGVEAVIDRNDNSIDYSQPYDVYNMNGFKVGESTDGLSQGIYIIRQGKAAVKTVVK